MKLSVHGNLCTAATFASLALSLLLSLSLSLSLSICFPLFLSPLSACCVTVYLPFQKCTTAQPSKALSLPRWQSRFSLQIVIPKHLGLQARSQDIRRVRSVHLPLCLANKPGRFSCAIILRARPHGPLHLTCGGGAETT